MTDTDNITIAMKKEKQNLIGGYIYIFFSMVKFFGGCPNMIFCEGSILFCGGLNKIYEGGLSFTVEQKLFGGGPKNGGQRFFFLTGERGRGKTTIRTWPLYD